MLRGGSRHSCFAAVVLVNCAELKMVRSRKKSGFFLSWQESMSLTEILRHLIASQRR